MERTYYEYFNFLRDTVVNSNGCDSSFCPFCHDFAKCGLYLDCQDNLLLFGEVQTILQQDYTRILCAMRINYVIASISFGFGSGFFYRSKRSYERLSGCITCALAGAGVNQRGALL